MLKLREDESFYHVSLVNKMEDPELEDLSSQMSNLSSGSGPSQQVHEIDISEDTIGVHPTVYKAVEADKTADDNMTGFDGQLVNEGRCGVLRGNGGDRGLVVPEGGGRGQVPPGGGSGRRSSPSRDRVPPECALGPAPPGGAQVPGPAYQGGVPEGNGGGGDDGGGGGGVEGGFAGGGGGGGGGGGRGGGSFSHPSGDAACRAAYGAARRRGAQHGDGW